MKAFDMDRRSIPKLLTLTGAVSLAWLGVALVCYGPLYASVYRVYTNVVRDIVQVRCGRAVANELIYTLEPGTCRFRNAEFDTKLRIDRDGFRNGPEAPGAGASAGSISVAVLGDSFAMGWGVEQDETLASRLARDPRLTVRDLSMSSYGTARELFALVRFAPDARVVILQYCANDRAENAAFLADPRGFAKGGGPRARDYHAYRDAEERRGAPGRWQRVLLEAPLAGLAATWRLLSLPPRTFPPSPAASLVDEARLFAGVVARFRRPLEGKTLIVFDAHAHGVRVDAADVLRRALREVGMGSARVVDLAGLLEPEDFFHLDDHWNARGHAKLARRLGEEIVRSGVLDGRSDD